MVTVRGKREGQPLVLSYQGYYPTNHHPSFPDALEQLMLRSDVRRILFQAGSGLSAVVAWQAPSPSVDFVLALIDQVRSVANTLG